jgi:16S rRNA (cytosine1402-N4)-methyltransferase
MNMDSVSLHQAVMTQEAIEALKPTSRGSYVDCTLGGGTHSQSLLEASAPDGRVLSMDVDPEALRRAREKFSSYGQRWVGVEGNFRHLEQIARESGWENCQGVLLDLGFSSDELADRKKGLSFLTDGPLDMRFGPQSNDDGLTAAEIVNGWRREELEQMIRDYGEERYAGKIADKILSARKKARIIGTLDLTAVIRSAVPKNYERGRIHPATRTFQALRIAVNDELGALREAILGARQILAPGGRLAIISFHSLEDRIVKLALREADDLEIITKKPLIPSAQEIAANPRSRSAKLRVAKKF